MNLKRMLPVLLFGLACATPAGARHTFADLARAAGTVERAPIFAELLGTLDRAEALGNDINADGCDGWDHGNSPVAEAFGSVTGRAGSAINMLPSDVARDYGLWRHLNRVVRAFNKLKESCVARAYLGRYSLTRMRGGTLALSVRILRRQLDNIPRDLENARNVELIEHLEDMYGH